MSCAFGRAKPLSSYSSVAVPIILRDSAGEKCRFYLLSPLTATNDLKTSNPNLCSRQGLQEATRASLAPPPVQQLSRVCQQKKPAGFCRHHPECCLHSPPACTCCLSARSGRAEAGERSCGWDAARRGLSMSGRMEESTTGT